jgi:hypothetical protein
LKYKKCEIEVSPHLLKKLFEWVREPTVQATDLHWVMTNIINLSSCDELLTLDEFEMIIKKPITA